MLNLREAKCCEHWQIKNGGIPNVERDLWKTHKASKCYEIPNVERDLWKHNKASKCDEIPNVERDLRNTNKSANVMQFQCGK